ncbi:MAG: putative N-acyltransferase [Myxococcota bacterium]
MTESPRVKVLDSYGEVDPAAWDALVGDGSPFLEHTYLWGLEEEGCATPEAGWTPRPIVVYDGDRLVAAAPGWVKTHSRGEFVYDHGWADAARRAGIGYYPKLVIGVPFTPVTGQRFLVHPELPRERWLPPLLAGVEAATRGTHGLHVLFNTEAESRWLDQQGAFERLQFQFHWFNEGYANFEEFLLRFKSKSRNKIRRERRDAARLQITSTTAPSADALGQLHAFYSNTCEQFGPWGRVYLSEAFFQRLGERWGHRLHTVVARDGERLVGGAFNVVKGGRLYGRYWGCAEDVPFLHFEVCYYQAIDYAIANGLQVFEPGHGGGHKYRRGFVPTLTYSSHAFVDRRLHDGLKTFSMQEAVAVRDRAVELTESGPLRPVQ